MRSTIHELPSSIRPFAEIMEEVHNAADILTRLQSLEELLFNTFWNQEHDDAFKLCKAGLTNRIISAHRDSSQRISAYNDASYIIWWWMFTPRPRLDLSLSRPEKRHQPLCFFWGHLYGQERRRLTLGKKAYLIKSAI